MEYLGRAFQEEETESTKAGGQNEHVLFEDLEKVQND